MALHHSAEGRNWQLGKSQLNDGACEFLKTRKALGKIQSKSTQRFLFPLRDT
jgi:hypothetical protein